MHALQAYSRQGDQDTGVHLKSPDQGLQAPSIFMPGTSVANRVVANTLHPCMQGSGSRLRMDQGMPCKICKFCQSEIYNLHPRSPDRYSSCKVAPLHGVASTLHSHVWDSSSRHSVSQSMPQEICLLLWIMQGGLLWEQAALGSC